MSEITLPSSPESERSILGAILLENAIPPEVQGLTADDFALDGNKKIFATLAAMGEVGEPIEIVTLTQRMVQQKELESVGGAGYLASLTDGIPRRSSVTHHVRVVRDTAMRRQLVHSSNAIIATACEGGSSADSIIQSAQDIFMRMSLASGDGQKDIFVDVADFCLGEDREPDWLVEGLIERGSNGIIAADPKGAKSLTTACLAVCLALGLPWLGMNVKRRTRVAVVSREDNPETTKRRIRQIVRGKGAELEEMRGWCHVNSKAQSPSLMLDNPREVAGLIRSLKKWESEFLILDVFNKMHSVDENNNTEIRAVMNQLDRVQAETGVQACVLHHWNKGDASQSLTRRIRGAGAIAGYAEWIAGIELVDEQNQVRCMRFETKVGEFCPPVNYRIEDNRFNNSLNFKLMEAASEPEPPKRGWK